MKHYYVYILCSKPFGTLYIGVTNNLNRRLYEHQQNRIQGFSHTYNTLLLVHAEQFILHSNAIHREKQLKKWKRQWKIDLIKQHNPQWNDLAKNLL